MGWPSAEARHPLNTGWRRPSCRNNPFGNLPWPCLTSTRFSMSSNAAQHSRLTRTRREFVRDAFCGFGSLALASILRPQELRAGGINPLSERPPHLPAKAKAVIFLFMAGGPSHLETFDPKPL